MKSLMILMIDLNRRLSEQLPPMQIVIGLSIQQVRY